MQIQHINKFSKIFSRADFKLVLFLAYIGSLLITWFMGHSWLSVLCAHLFFVSIFSIIYFSPKFLLFFFAPLIAAVQLIQSYSSKRYLKNFKQSVPAEVVIVLGQSDWSKLEAWFKHNFLKSEIVSLVQYLKEREQDFSFYPKASVQDIEKIMSDKCIKEVYFLGHGSSHLFKLTVDEPLYYCDFNDPEKYGKEFVHQVHCGTSHGKSLIDYVVPEKNKTQCFMFRKTINSRDIEKEFKRRIKNIAAIKK
jgi:hypothetical protein